MTDFQTSVFHNFSHHQGVLPLNEVILSVRGNKHKVQIEKIRQFSSQGKKDLADKLKKTLPAFTPSGVFTNGRRLELLHEYNPVICLDFDNVNGSMEILRNKVDALPTTYASFISPGGNGLKVFVLTNSAKEKHLMAFNQVADLYETQTGILSDRSVKDIPRLCFLSYDPDLYLNISCDIFQVVPDTETIPPKNGLQPDYAAIFTNCVINTEKVGYYINGNRNNFIFRLANFCKLSGIPFEQTLLLCSTSYDLDIRELTAVVRSAFLHNKTDFADFADFATFQNSNNTEDGFLKSSPTIPQEEYDLMPEIIKKGIFSFSNPRERDVFFTGAISILSGCLPNVQGIYNQQIVYPNLFSFVIAPPASGKGVLKYSRAMGNKIQENFIQLNQKKEDDYQEELLAYNHRSRKKNAKPEKPPVIPRHQVFYIPANSSYAKILSHLKDNHGHGVICETEADTMSNILKKEWGCYSDLLRKAFHHEAISSSRKTNNEFLEIPSPKLSMALTGTPGQIEGLISSAEDGLFSRFLFYIYKAKPIWNDVSPKPGQLSLTEKFSLLSQEVFDHYTFLNSININFCLTPKQWEMLNESFSGMLSDVTSFTSDNAASIVKRLGLLHFRIAMIFTALRKKNQENTALEIYCSNQDFQLALRLSKIYLQHSLIIYNSLPQKSSKIVFKETPNKEAFYNELTKTFSRADAIALGSNHGLSSRTIDGLLKKLLESRLKKTKNGMYEKV